ncbi:hypothetical protein NIES39_J04300 [Arthrospira platensis NIES-39]|nr:hypothetical protein NIES39_J04300 [Arthrospira platensis NIES-39]
MTQPCRLGFWEVGWVEVTKPNATISQLCWVSLRLTQPTWLRFWGSEKYFRIFQEITC